MTVPLIISTVAPIGAKNLADTGVISVPPLEMTSLLPGSSISFAETRAQESIIALPHIDGEWPCLHCITADDRGEEDDDSDKSGHNTGTLYKFVLLLKQFYY